MKYSGIIEIKVNNKDISELLTNSKLIFKITDKVHPTNLIDYIYSNNIDKVQNIFYHEILDIGDIIFNDKIIEDIHFYNGFIPLNVAIKYINNTNEISKLKNMLKDTSYTIHQLIKDKNILINFNLI